MTEFFPHRQFQGDYRVHQKMIVLRFQTSTRRMDYPRSKKAGSSIDLIVYRSKYPVEPLKNCSRSSLWHVSNPPRSQWANVKEPEHLYLNSEAISSMALWRQSMIGLSFYIKDYEDIWIQGS